MCTDTNIILLCNYDIVIYKLSYNYECNLIRSALQSLEEHIEIMKLLIRVISSIEEEVFSSGRKTVPPRDAVNILTSANKYCRN